MNTSRTSSMGKRALKALVLIPLVMIAIIALTFGFYEARKAYWDHQVDKLCAQDGGVKINEVMYLDPKQYEQLVDKKFGTRQLVIPNKSSPESKEAIAFLADSTSYVKKNNPTVVRDSLMIVRATDGVVLATHVSYSRGDGDLISFQPSSHSCPARAPYNFIESTIKLKANTK